MKHIPGAVAVLDTEIKYVAVSDRWYKDYNLEGRDIIGVSHYEIFPEILEMPNWLADHQAALKGAILEKHEDKFIRENGDVQWLRWKIYPWYKDKNNIGGMIFYTEVITESKEKEISLEQTNKKLTNTLEELQSKNKQLEEFTRITAHNLRSPATNLIALSKLYQTSSDVDSKNKIIEHIASSSQNLVDTIDDLQKILILQVNVDGHEKQEIFFEKAFHTVFEQIDTLLKIAEGSIETDFSQIDKISFSKTFLESIFINLISNAIKYRSPDRNLVIRIFSEQKEGETLLHIQDNGLGIDLKKHGKKLFKMGKTFHNNKDSRGIGLFMIKNQLEILGSKITVDSEVNVGTTFTIIF